jgi:hypothetical protein
VIHRAADLGVSAWTADVLGLLEVVDVDRLTGHFIFLPITVQDAKYWLTVVYDHVCFFFYPSS